MTLIWCRNVHLYIAMFLACCAIAYTVIWFSDMRARVKQQEEAMWALEYEEKYGPIRHLSCMRSGKSYSQEEFDRFMAVAVPSIHMRNPENTILQSYHEAERAFSDMQFEGVAPCPSDVELK